MKIALIISVILNIVIYLHFSTNQHDISEVIAPEVKIEREIIEKTVPVITAVTDKESTRKAREIALEYLALPFDDKLTDSRRDHLKGIFKFLASHDKKTLEVLLEFANNNDHFEEDSPEDKVRFAWLEGSLGSWQEITEKIKNEGESSIDDIYLEKAFTKSTFGLMKSIKGAAPGSVTEICNDDICEKVSLDDELHLEDVESLINRISSDGVGEIFKVNIGGSLADFNNKKTEGFITYYYHKKNKEVEYLIGAYEEGNDGKKHPNTYRIKYNVTNTSH